MKTKEFADRESKTTDSLEVVDDHRRSVAHEGEGLCIAEAGAV